jgi:hypothetical protein
MSGEAAGSEVSWGAGFCCQGMAAVEQIQAGWEGWGLAAGAAVARRREARHNQWEGVRMVGPLVAVQPGRSILEGSLRDNCL